MTQLSELKQAKAIHQQALLNKPNVVGLGIGYKVSGKTASDELSVVVLVRKKIPLAGLQDKQVIPKSLDGVRTDIIEVGDLRALWDHTIRWRPAPGGVSLGHYQVSAGSFGGMVRDRTTGARLILSNNHVIANQNEAQPGDPILQPAPADGGTLANDVIARLERFYPLNFSSAPPTCNIAQSYARFGNFLARMSGSQHQVQALKITSEAVNTIDAAVARPVDNAAVLDEILEIGTVSGVREAFLGMLVRKSGRTTALTSGTVTVLDATISISYGYDRTATFEHQVVTTPMSTGGDSGSLVLDSATPNAVGLLFGGSEQASIFNPIQPVLDLLNVEFIPSASQAKSLLQEPGEKVQQVLQNYQEWLMSKANVVGVGIGRRQGMQGEEMVLVVMVSRKVPRRQLHPEDIIPQEIEGVSVDVREVGELAAQE